VQALKSLPPLKSMIAQSFPRQLMHERSLTLLDIALESGFTSNAHFSNIFRQHFCVTPSHFRRAL
jgi:AraC-like DNA-binding protein